jgi:hypothetical protein
MLREGGRWTTTEMQDVLGLEHLSDARGTLNSMAAALSVKRFEPKEPGASITFGVTSQCRVPMGVTLAELAQVGILKDAA